MQPIRFEEIKDLATHERVRAETRRSIIELRKLRRLRLGDRISVVFENRETILFQIQEILRAGRIVEEAAIQHEVDIYNELLPIPRQLTGSVFVELSSPAKIREEMEMFQGLEQRGHLWFDLGDRGRCDAGFDEDSGGAERATSVYRVRFTFSRETSAAFRSLSHPVSLALEHGDYTARADVEGPTRRSLAEDFSED